MLKNKLNPVYALVLFMLGLTVAGCSTQALYEVESQPVSATADGSTPSMEEVERAIIAAATDRGWSPRVVMPGMIEATLFVRTHQAIVDIPFSSSEYSIQYKDSTNLDYRNGSIHRNYNNWIHNLSNSIQVELNSM